MLGQITGSQMVEDFSWVKQGQQYSTDVILFLMVGCELILGMQWLKTLGSIVWHCLNLTIEFNKGDRRVKLTARRENKNQLLLEDKMQNQMMKLHNYMIHVVPWQENMQYYALKLDEEGAGSSKVHELWNEFHEVVTELAYIPPQTRGGPLHNLTGKLKSCEH